MTAETPIPERVNHTFVVCVEDGRRRKPMGVGIGGDRTGDGAWGTGSAGNRSLARTRIGRWEGVGRRKERGKKESTSQYEVSDAETGLEGE